MLNIKNPSIILFIASLLSQLKHLTCAQLSLLLIKITELNTDNHLDNIDKLVLSVGKKCGIFEQLPISDKNIHNAVEKANKWLQNDIFVLFPSKSLNNVLFAQGDPKILNSSTAAILNSRKVRFIPPTARWLQVTMRLTKQAIDKNLTIISSLGMLTYEIVTFIATKHHSKMIIVLDGYLPGVLPSDLQGAFYDKFRNMFDIKNTLFISPFWPEVRLPARNERLSNRDYWVVNLAKYIFIAEARADGNIQKLTYKAVGDSTRKVLVFCPKKFDQTTIGNQKLLLLGAEKVNYDDLVASDSRKLKLTHDEKIPTYKSSLKVDEYLFHYTRVCPGPWPNQPLSDYIHSLVEGESDAGHTAFDTLCRILKKQVIYANNRFVRGKTPVVSFSECVPAELDKIRKWNPALIRWTFEPYAIGIRKNTLKNIGAKPVIYAVEDEFSKLPQADKFRFQLHRPPKTNWVLEKEWRIVGDVILNNIAKEDMVIVVSTLQEATIINKEFSLPVILA